MNWYKTAQATYEVRDVHLRSKPAEQWLQFQEDGFYYGDEFEKVPIDKIEYDPWSKSRFEHALEGLNEGKKMPPVSLYYDEEQDIYLVSDGNHRVAASKQKGYTHVPAVVSKKIFKEPPKPPDEEIMYEKISHENLARFNEIKNFGYGLNKFDAVLDTTTPTGYRWLISHTGQWEEAPLTIEIDPNDPSSRIAKLDFEGQHFESRGPIEQVINDLKAFLRRVF